MPGFMALFESHQDCSLVIDPAHAMRSVEGVSELLDRLRARGSALRKVVLYADPTPEALRGVCVLASATACTLVVRGVDEETLVRERIGGIEDPLVAQQSLDTLAPKMAALPRRARERWERALTESVDTNSKQIVAELGITRRTMERWFQDCGLPSPGRVLKQVRDAQRSGTEADSSVGSDR